jgi:hypothetical protein
MAHDATELGPARNDDLKTDVLEHADKPTSAEQAVAVENQTRTRRLFSFAQLFAFSLTYMAVWEGMCTYVTTV